MNVASIVKDIKLRLSEINDPDLRILSGGVHTHNGRLHPYILVERFLVIADTGETMPPMIIQGTKPLPEFVSSESNFIKRLKIELSALAPAMALKDCPYFQQIVKNEQLYNH